MELKMKICSRCVLPESFPGIKFDENGVCNFCNSFKGETNLEQQKTKYKQKFEELLESKKGIGSYDVLMAYSGGKDSTYTMYALKETYNLKILALTLDNAFISKEAVENMRKVVEKLNIDMITYKPRFEVLRKVFIAGSKDAFFSKKTLDRASTICTSCIGFVKTIVLKTALDNRIPFIAFGWSPGQAPVNSSIFKNNPRMIRMMQDAIRKPLEAAAEEDISQYFLEERHYELADYFPTNISPLAFLEYSEEKMEEKIQELGWSRPKDTDSNSSNCLLNSLGIRVHKEKYQFHPYIQEVANMVREGVMSREDAIAKMAVAENDQTVQMIKDKLCC